jgi:hypothetical protein
MLSRPSIASPVIADNTAMSAAEETKRRCKVRARSADPTGFNESSFDGQRIPLRTRRESGASLRRRTTQSRPEVLWTVAEDEWIPRRMSEIREQDGPRVIVRNQPKSADATLRMPGQEKSDRCSGSKWILRPKF